MKKILPVFLILMVAANCMASSSAGTDMYVNSSEPAFLRNIGPRNPRTDNPVAAGIVTLGVAGVLYIGFRSERKKKALQDRMDQI